MLNFVGLGQTNGRSNFVPKMHHFGDIWLQKCRDLGIRVLGHSGSSFRYNTIARVKRKEGKKTPKTVATNWLFDQTTHVIGSKSNCARYVACCV